MWNAISLIQDLNSCRRNGYRHWFPKLLRRQSSGGCRFNPDCRRVTIQEYLIFVPVMAKGIRTGDARGSNKGCSSKFRVGSRVRQTPEEGRRTNQWKRCRNNNKDEDNSPKILNDKNHQASSQKFTQLLTSYLSINLIFIILSFVVLDLYSTILFQKLWNTLSLSLSLTLSLYIYIYLPLRMSRMWHKDKFLSGV